MSEVKKHQIITTPDSEKYYIQLEAIRQSGICNMWGAAEVLRAMCPELSIEEAREYLLSWIENYAKLNAKYGWQKV